jgi:hypothetical protein
MADPKDVAKKDGKAFRTHDVDVVREFVAPGYEVDMLENNERGATGLLTVVRIKRPGQWPTFEGRWDEKATALDFEAVDAEDKRSKTGFDGHHSVALPERRFRVEIRYPSGGARIFAGVVSFGLGFELALSDEFKASASLTTKAEVIRDGEPIE